MPSARHDSALKATLTGLWDLVGQKPVVLDETVRVEGETVMVTGASRGLGLALSSALADRGATVLMACRSRVQEAPEEVRHAVDGCTVEGLSVDLTEPAQVAALVQRLVDDGVVLDRVVLNAGVVPSSSRQTAAGLDLMVHVNFLANVQLVDLLRRHGRLRPGARVVVVGSEAHKSAPLVDLGTWTRAEDYGTGGVLAAYGRSKRLLHTWAEALAADAPELRVIHLCPGAIASDIAREAPASLQVLVKPTMRLFFPSPEKAARSVLFAALSPTLRGRTGVYLHLGREKDPAEGVRDPAQYEPLFTSALTLGRRLLDEAAPESPPEEP